jgi:hypothetical protein
MGGLFAPFAIPVLVYDQNALLVRSRRVGFVEQKFAATPVDLLGIPPRLGKKPLQALRLLTLRSSHGFGVGQSRQGLVALGGEQKPFQVAPETFALSASREKIVETASVVFERSWGGSNGQSIGHGYTSSSSLEHNRELISTNYRYTESA